MRIRADRAREGMRVPITRPLNSLRQKFRPTPPCEPSFDPEFLAVTWDEEGFPLNLRG